MIPKILLTGANDKADVLKDLPIKLYLSETGREAIKCLRNKKIDAVISRWELLDLKNGEFLKSVIEAKPDVPTIAIIKNGDYVQEVAARSIGVKAVLTEDTDDEQFRKTVCLINNMQSNESIDCEIEGIEYIAINSF